MGSKSTRTRVGQNSTRTRVGQNQPRQGRGKIQPGQGWGKINPDKVADKGGAKLYGSERAILPGASTFQIGLFLTFSGNPVLAEPKLENTDFQNILMHKYRASYSSKIIFLIINIIKEVFKSLSTIQRDR